MSCPAIGAPCLRSLFPRVSAMLSQPPGRSRSSAVPIARGDPLVAPTRVTARSRKPRSDGGSYLSSACVTRPGSDVTYPRRFPQRQALALPSKLTCGEVKGFTLYATQVILSGQGEELVELVKTNLRDLEIGWPARAKPRPDAAGLPGYERRSTCSGTRTRAVMTSGRSRCSLPARTRS